MDSLLNDLRYALRRLLSSPGFTLAAILTMTLGIGANSTIFTIVNAIMLRPLAVASPEQLVEVYTIGSDGVPATSSYPDYLDYRDLPVFQGGAAAYEGTILNWTDGGTSRVLFAESTSGNYFSVLGLTPTIGRFYGPEDDRAGAPPVVVLGTGFWERHFGADPTVIGRPLTINGHVFTVIGVGSRDYKGGIVGLAVDLWLPVNVEYDISWRQPNQRTSRGGRSLFVRGRLAEGASVAQAQAALNVVTSRLAQAYPDTNARRTTSVMRSKDIRFHPEVDKALAPVAALLMAVPALVLLIACANIANLLLARASGRAREIAVRLSLGANRLRLVRLLLIESLALAITGGAFGLLLAWWLIRAATGWVPPGLPIPLAIDLEVDYRVLWFTFGLSAITGIVFGLAPALQTTNPALLPALKEQQGDHVRGYRRFGLRNALVIAQLAVSLVLLTAAGLFIRSLQHAQQIDPGFERERAIILTPAMMMSGLPRERRVALTEAIRERMASLPGVERVGLADRLPLGASIRITDVLINDQQPDANGRGTEVDEAIIGPGYFAAMSVPIIRGRDFSERDDKSSPLVVVVSDAFAQQYFPGADPIGQRIRLVGRPNQPAMEVIGIARDTKVRTLGESPRPYMYLPWRQTDDDVGFVIRTGGDPAPVVAAVRREMQAIAPDLAILTLWTMREHLSLMLTPPRLAAVMLGVCGTLAILLASLGLYAVVAFTVVRRTKEIGIRVALGATRAQVVSLVVREGMALVSVGTILGLALAAAVSAPLSSYLYGLGAFDPATFAAVAAVLAMTALVANYLPARRAVCVDPLRAIRYE